MVLGIMGKIASGKTEVMKVLEEHGFRCVYADKVVHKLYESGGEGSKEIERVFGEEYLKDDGSVDRKKLRGLVFDDLSKLELLNATIHPLVYKKIEIMDLAGNVAIESVYFDDELLGDFVDEIVWVERPMDKIKKVLIEDREFHEELIEKTINIVNKPKDFDYFINNSGTLNDLKLLVCRTFHL